MLLLLFGWVPRFFECDHLVGFNAGKSLFLAVRPTNENLIYSRCICQPEMDAGIVAAKETIAGHQHSGDFLSLDKYSDFRTRRIAL